MLRRSLILLQSRREHYKAKLGFYLLLTSLGIFFLSSMIAYVIIARIPPDVPPAVETFNVSSGTVVSDAAAGEIQPATFRSRISYMTTIQKANARRHVIPLHVPSSFLVSTVLLIGVSIILHRAVENVHQERQQRFRICLMIALVLSFGFCFAQWFGLNELISTHSSRGNGDAKLYGISFTLALVHALHVVGGLLFLWLVTMRGMKNAYDHEHHYAVDLCATYWHFLDGVWIAMLATFLITRPL